MTRPHVARPDLGSFLDTVYPPLFERLDSAFPEFGFERHGDNWTATAWPADLPLQAEDKRPDRLIVYRDHPWWIKLHGHEGVRLLDYVNGGRKPTGPEFPAAVRQLCDRAGVAFPDREPTAQEVARAVALEDRRRILERLVEYTARVLWSETGAAARAFLTARGLTDEEIRSLGLGLYVDSAVVRDGLAKEFSPTAIRESAAGWKRLEGYVVIPWRDSAGRVLTVYGRWPTKVPPEGKPKTIALPGKDTKGVPLYLDRALKAKLEEVVLVEGVFDAALLQVRGDKRVVADVGASIATNQLEALKRHGIKRVIICGDPDAGGDQGTLANVKKLTAAGIAAFVAPRLPEGMDPDELVAAHGIDAWKAHVAKSVTGARHLVDKALEDVTPESPETDRSRSAEGALDVLADFRGLGDEAIVALIAERTGYPRRTLSAALTKRRKAREDSAKAANDTGSGTSLAFVDPEPWPEPVALAEVLDEIVATFGRFLIVPREALLALSLWPAHTFLADAFEHSPRLAIESPVKRCGKSRTLALIAAAAFRPISCANITAAALFRTVEAFRPTLLIDEADSFLKDNEELRGILNAGFECDGAVVRTVGEEHEPRRFRAFAPAALAAIGKLPSTLEDRSIVVEMKRRTPGEKVERLRRRHLTARLADARRKLARWAADERDALSDADPEVPEELDDRAADIWRPLLAIADSAGGDWPERARDAARTLSGGRDKGESGLGVLLLADLRSIFTEKGVERLSTEDVLAALLALAERPWRDLRQGNESKPITSQKLASLLKPFDIVPRAFRDESGTSLRGYSRDSCADAFGRYLVADAFEDFESATPQQTNHAKALGESESATAANRVADSNRRNLNGRTDRCGVADSDPHRGGLFTLDPDRDPDEGGGH